MKSFLTTLGDLIKYTMKYKCIWVKETLQLASSYNEYNTSNWIVTINHYWVFVVTSDSDPMWILVKWWGRNVVSNILEESYVEDTVTTSVGHEEKVM